MYRFIGKRVVHLVTVLIGISFLSFFLANIAPVDPAEAYARRLSKGVSEETIESYREEFGFNESIPKQYLNWLGNVLRLDFGSSYITGRPAMRDIFSVLPLTLILALLASAFIILFSIPLGILSAMREGKAIDKIVCGLSFVSISVPGYFLGLLCLLLFGIQLGIMPVIGHGHPASLVCGAFVLAFPMIGTLTRILRSQLLENSDKDYVTYAKARGISKRKIMTSHLLRNAAPACLTMFGQNIGYLIAGTTIVETIFSTPGLGQYALNAALNRDFPVINAYIVIMALFFVVCNIAAEAGGILLNPQLRGGGVQ